MSGKRKVDDALSSKDLAEDDTMDAKPKLLEAAASSSSSSSAGSGQQQASAENASAAGITPDQLRYYYANIFPFKDMFMWLAHGNDPHSSSPHVDRDFFLKREFSMTIEEGKDEIYMRYRSYKDDKDWKKELVEKLPVKIDIGAVYTCSPAMRQTVKQFHPVEKELVFDIDMTDYDDIRKCCDGAKICPKCWQLMTAAVKVIDVALREDFGFSNIMFVYSGRRGIHCWVSDARACTLSNEARSAIVEYLTFYQGGANQAKKVNISTPVHPSVYRAYKILSPHFLAYVDGQEFFSFPENQEAFLAMMPEEYREGTRTDWADPTKGSAYKFKQLRKRMLDEKDAKRREQNEVIVMEMVFSLIYPRLDVNVSKQMHHLLKSPFCVHPKTGRVCVPINPAEVEQFSPFDVPTLSKLIDEMDQLAKSEMQVDKAKSDAAQTSLAPYVAFFHDGIVTPIADALRRQVQSSTRALAATDLSF